MRHIVTLSNGQHLLVEERLGRLSIAEADGTDACADPRYYICEISSEGVLVMPNSGDATHCLTYGLKETGDQP